jgi:hypothetical protein
MLRIAIQDKRSLPWHGSAAAAMGATVVVAAFLALPPSAQANGNEAKEIPTPAQVIEMREKRMQEHLASFRAAHPKTDEETEKRTQALLASFRAAYASISDMSCTVELTQTGGIGEAYLKNKIRAQEIYRDRQLIPKPQAEKQIEELKEELKAEIARTAAAKSWPGITKWRMRSDGLFHVIQRLPETLPSNPGPWETTVAFDGEHMRYHDPAQRRGSVLTKAPGFTFSPKFAISISGEPLEDFVLRALKEGSIELADEQGAGGEKLVKITAINPSPRERIQPFSEFARIWLSLSRNLMPTRIERGHPYGQTPADWPVIDVISDIVGQELVPGVWYPISSTCTGGVLGDLADPDLPMDKWKMVAFPTTSITKCNLRDIRVNQGLKRDAFSITFPVGTRISDQFLDVGAVVGLGIDQEIDQEVAALSTQIGSGAIPKGVPAAKQIGVAPSTRFKRVSIYAVFIAVIGLAAILILYRERRRGKSQTDPQLPVI